MNNKILYKQNITVFHVNKVVNISQNDIMKYFALLLNSQSSLHWLVISK